LPIHFKKKAVGWIHKSNLEVYQKSKNQGTLIRLEDLKKLSSLIKPKNLTKEICPIFDYQSLQPKVKFDHKKIFCQEKIYEIERDLLSLFGLPAYGVHCNVWSKYKNSILIHLAVRSKKVKNFPGLYDNLVAGGQPSKISIIENLHKEAFEEAGLKKKLMWQAKKSKTTHYMHTVGKKFNSAIIFIYQLEKTSEMKFENQDGEVDGFVTIDVCNINEILKSKLLKANCIIPILDLLILRMSEYIPKSFKKEINSLLNN